MVTSGRNNILRSLEKIILVVSDRERVLAGSRGKVFLCLGECLFAHLKRPMTSAVPAVRAQHSHQDENVFMEGLCLLLHCRQCQSPCGLSWKPQLWALVSAIPESKQTITRWPLSENTTEAKYWRKEFDKVGVGGQYRERVPEEVTLTQKLKNKYELNQKVVQGGHSRRRELQMLRLRFC